MDFYLKWNQNVVKIFFKNSENLKLKCGLRRNKKVDGYQMLLNNKLPHKW